MEQKVGLFGVGFDPLPSNQALAIKHAYIQAKVLGKIASTDYTDPYAFFSNNLPEAFSGRFDLLGQVSIPTWLQPKPRANDSFGLTLDSLIHFMKSGGCLSIADKVRDFVNANVFPRIPGMIGVDHSSTYGVISALREQRGEDLALVVIDSHFDAVPMALRHGLVEHAKNTDSISIPPDLLSVEDYPNLSPSEISEWGKLNPENVVLHMLEHKLIDPKNLVVVGISDYPPKAYEESEDPHVRDYLDYFKSLEEQGTRFIPKSSIDEHGTKDLAKALQSLSARRVYVSLDMDVGSLSSVYACRFLSNIGLSFDQIEDLFQTLFSTFSNGLTLAGFDIMEVDIHKLGAKIDNRHIDQATEIGRRFLEFVGQVI
ncbi:arginase family protein [Thermodesulfobacteriota bacterium]